LLRGFVGQRFPHVCQAPQARVRGAGGEWIKGDLRERIDDLFAGPQAADYFDRSRLRGMLNTQRTRGQDLSKPIWAVFVLLQWAEAEGNAAVGHD
jgi:hypothetical protein